MHKMTIYAFIFPSIQGEDIDFLFKSGLPVQTQIFTLASFITGIASSRGESLQMKPSFSGYLLFKMAEIINL